MPFQRVIDCAMAELIYDQFDQTVENTLYFKDNSGTTLSTVAGLSSLLAALDAWWAGEIMPLQPTSVTLREIVVTWLDVETGPQSTLPVADPGTDASPALPSNDTICVSFRTADIGRSHRGRNYFIGLKEDEVTGNTLQASTLADITLAYAALPDYITTEFGTDVEWCVASRFHDGVERTAGITTPITSVLIVDDSIDSQRRRLTGRGD